MDNTGESLLVDTAMIYLGHSQEWVLKAIFAALYIKFRTEKANALRLYRAKWKQDPNWIKKDKAHQSEYWHRKRKFIERPPINKIIHNRQERERWKNDPLKRAKKYAYHREFMKRPEQRAKTAARRKHHYDNDPWVKFVNSARSRIWASLKQVGRKKWGSVAELVGCTREEMISHIESQFQPGMSWSNHGEWHIDHEIPLASFDLSTLDGQKAAFNYKNNRPMWSLDNIKKSSIYNGVKHRYNKSLKP